MRNRGRGRRGGRLLESTSGGLSWNPLAELLPSHGWDGTLLTGAAGSDVTSVSNRVSGGPALTNSATAPTLSLAIKNGLNAIRFAGGDRRLTSGAFGAAIAQPFYWFFVGQIDAANVRVLDSATSRNLAGCTAAGAYNMATPPSGTISSANSLNDNSWSSLVYRFDGATSTGSRNGVQIISGTVSNVSLDSIIIGADNSGAFPFTGYMGELWIVPAANVTPLKVVQWEAYARSKYFL